MFSNIQILTNHLFLTDSFSPQTIYQKKLLKKVDPNMPILIFGTRVQPITFEQSAASSLFLYIIFLKLDMLSKIKNNL